MNTNQFETTTINFADVKKCIIDTNHLISRNGELNKKIFVAKQLVKNLKTINNELHLDMERVNFKYNRLKPEYDQVQIELADTKEANLKLTEMYKEAVVECRDMQEMQNKQLNSEMTSTSECMKKGYGKIKNGAKERVTKINTENTMNQLVTKNEELENQVLELQSEIINLQLLAEDRKKQIEKQTETLRLNLEKIQFLQNENLILSLKNNSKENLKQNVTYSKAVQVSITDTETEVFRRLTKLEESEISFKAKFLACENDDGKETVMEENVVELHKAHKNSSEPEQQKNDIEEKSLLSPLSFPIIEDESSFFDDGLDIEIKRILKITALSDSVFDKKGHPPGKKFTPDDFQPVLPLSDDEDDLPMAADLNDLITPPPSIVQTVNSEVEHSTDLEDHNRQKAKPIEKTVRASIINEIKNGRPDSLEENKINNDETTNQKTVIVAQQNEMLDANQADFESKRVSIDRELFEQSDCIQKRHDLFTKFMNLSIKTFKNLSDNLINHETLQNVKREHTNSRKYLDRQFDYGIFSEQIHCKQCYSERAHYMILKNTFNQSKPELLGFTINRKTISIKPNNNKPLDNNYNVLQKLLREMNKLKCSFTLETNKRKTPKLKQATFQTLESESSSETSRFPTNPAVTLKRNKDFFVQAKQQFFNAEEEIRNMDSESELISSTPDLLSEKCASDDFESNEKSPDTSILSPQSDSVINKPNLCSVNENLELNSIFFEKQDGSEIECASISSDLSTMNSPPIEDTTSFSNVAEEQESTVSHAKLPVIIQPMKSVATRKEDFKLSVSVLPSSRQDLIKPISTIHKNFKTFHNVETIAEFAKNCSEQPKPQSNNNKNSVDVSSNNFTKDETNINLEEDIAALSDVAITHQHKVDVSPTSISDNSFVKFNNHEYILSIPESSTLPNERITITTEENSWQNIPELLISKIDSIQENWQKKIKRKSNQNGYCSSTGDKGSSLTKNDGSIIKTTKEFTHKNPLKQSVCEHNNLIEDLEIQVDINKPIKTKAIVRNGRKRKILSKDFVSNSNDSDSSECVASGKSKKLVKRKDSSNTPDSNRNMKDNRRLSPVVERAPVEHTNDIQFPNHNKDAHFNISISPNCSEQNNISTQNLSTTDKTATNHYLFSTQDNASPSSDKKKQKVVKCRQKPSLRMRLLGQLRDGNRCNKIVPEESLGGTNRRCSTSNNNNNNNKINIIQDIVISKTGNINSAVKVENIIQNNMESEKLNSRNKITSMFSPKANSTPVNILSQVMNDMTKCQSKESIKELQVKPDNSVSNIEIIENNSKMLKSKANIFDTDSPVSPELIESRVDTPVKLPIDKSSRIPAVNLKKSLNKLMVFSSDPQVLDEVVTEFAFQDGKYISKIIIQKLIAFPLGMKSPLDESNLALSTTQKILLGFICKLDNSLSCSNIFNEICDVIEEHLFIKKKDTKKLTFHIVESMTRFYTAICKLNNNVNRMRKFIFEVFYFMENQAIPIFFIVLIMWGEMWSIDSDGPMPLLQKVIVQICYLKDCAKPGYNLLPLRDLLQKYYGYPKERWNCEHIFQELLNDYKNNPVILSSCAILLFLKNKPSKWVLNKVKSDLIPLSLKNDLKVPLMFLINHIYSSLDPRDTGVIEEMKKLIIALS